MLLQSRSIQVRYSSHLLKFNSLLTELLTLSLSQSWQRSATCVWVPVLSVMMHISWSCQKYAPVNLPPDRPLITANKTHTPSCHYSSTRHCCLYWSRNSPPTQIYISNLFHMITMVSDLYTVYTAIQVDITAQFIALKIVWGCTCIQKFKCQN